MRKGLVIVVSLSAIAVGWWVMQQGRSITNGMRGQMGKAHYVAYVGNDPALQVTFEYPQGRSVQEETGQVERFRQVRLMGPRNRDDSYTAYLSVLGTPLKAYGGKYPNKEEFLRNYTSHLQQGAQIVSTTSTKISGAAAIDITVSYTMPPWHHQDLKAVEVPVKARTIVVEKPPYLYQLTYSADAREYDAHAPAFEHLRKTFRFLQ